MKTGDTVRDDRGRTLQVGQLLGRGLWGRTYAARDEGSGTSLVLKVPHRASDLPENTGAHSAASLADACAEIALELGRLYEQGGCAALPRLDGRVALDDGTPCLVLPKASSVEHRLSTGATLDELLRSLIDATQQLRAFSHLQSFHGNLKPTNLLVGDNGVVWLTDPVTPAFRKVYPTLLRATRGQSASQWCAPEVREATGSVPFGAPADTYALAMVLFRAAMVSPGHERFPELPVDGLSKSRLVTLKDRVLNRLKAEHSNPRFHSRLADRLSALLNRALSKQTSPSPPYRFRRLEEFGQRLTEVQAMVHPTVTHVGRLILDHGAGQDGFITDEEVRFSATVACSSGVDNHEEIACGLAVFDLDHDTRVRLDECSYAVDRHPSGRFRFSFRVGTQRPGGYRVRIAFTIRESGDQPLTAEGDFRVRPAPGYVPPLTEPVSAPLPLRSRAVTQDEETARKTEPGVRSAAAPARSLPTPQRDPASTQAAAQPAQRSPRPAATTAPAPPRKPAGRSVAAVVEDTADPLSADLPLPTPIAPVAPVERTPRSALRARTESVAVSVRAPSARGMSVEGAEDCADDPSTPAEDRLLLSPDSRASRNGRRPGRTGASRDSVPRDSVPRDSVPRDSVPRDSAPRDSALAVFPPAPTPRGGRRTTPSRPSPMPRARVTAPVVERGIEPTRSASTTPPATFGGRATTPPSAFAGGSVGARPEPRPEPISADRPTVPMGGPGPATSAAVRPRPVSAEERSFRTAPGLQEAADRAAEPAPRATSSQPAFSSLGRWTELPLPIHETNDLAPPVPEPVAEVTVDPDTDDAFGEQGPVGAMFAQLIETVRSDLYIMVIGSMALACAGLAVLLMVLKG